MRQLAPSHIEACIGSPLTAVTAKNLVLTGAQANSLGASLLEDAKGAVYSAVVSLADALAGLQRGYFSWATVKLYYVCFYLAKAALARRGHAVFYVNTSPFKLTAVAGASPQVQSGNSHTVVTALYKAVVTSGVLNLQPIASIHAFTWLTRRREEVNYREQRFSDPLVPAWFAMADVYGARRVIGDYVGDLSLYAFDEAHAMLALPLAALIEECKSTVGFYGSGLTADESRILRGLLIDKAGPIHHFSFIDVN